MTKASPAGLSPVHKLSAQDLTDPFDCGREDLVGLCDTAMRKAIASQPFDSFAEDLLAERSVRPLVIVGASKVDDLLVEMLRVFLLPKTARSNDQDELLDGDNPLATFSARIKMCRRLGLIDATLSVALERLRVLRNLSAHSISFDHGRSPVREHLGELRRHVASRRSYDLTRTRYFDNAPLREIEEWQCLLLTLCVLLEVIGKKVRRTSGCANALRIAAK